MENHVLSKSLFLKYNNSKEYTDIKVEPSYDLIEENDEDIKPDAQYEDFSGDIDYFNDDSTDVKNGEFHFQLGVIFIILRK